MIKYDFQERRGIDYEQGISSVFQCQRRNRKLAERHAEAIGADLHEIQPEVPYTDADLDWMDKKSRSSVEMNDKSFRPAVANDMGIKKKGAALLLVATMVLGLGTTAFAATNLANVETISDNIIVIGKDAEKEADGIAKISLDMGNTWIAESEYLSSDEKSVDYWTYEEYKSHAEIVESGLVKMLAVGEPDLTEADIYAWQEHAAQMLAFIEAGGKVSKNSTEADSEIMISGFDSCVVETMTEKK